MRFSVNKFVQWCLERNTPKRDIRLAVNEWARELDGMTKEEIYEKYPKYILDDDALFE